MKKIALMLLAASLLLQLAGCGLFKTESTDRRTRRRKDREVTTSAAEQAQPSAEYTEASMQETTEAVELTPTTPVPYILYPPAEACIFKQPDASSEFVRVFGHEGAYTIVEERYDEDGNLWAKLKSGIGWTNVTDPFCGGPDAPIVVAAYASKQVLEGDYHLAGLFTGNEFKVNVSILAHETVTRVQIRENDMINGRVGKVLYSLDQLDPEKPLVAHLIFPGDFSSYVVTYTDANNISHEILLWMSMDDSNFIGWF